MSTTQKPSQTYVIFIWDPESSLNIFSVLNEFLGSMALFGTNFTNQRNVTILNNKIDILHFIIINESIILKGFKFPLQEFPTLKLLVNVLQNAHWSWFTNYEGSFPLKRKRSNTVKQVMNGSGNCKENLMSFVYKRLIKKWQTLYLNWCSLKNMWNYFNKLFRQSYLVQILRFSSNLI